MKYRVYVIICILFLLSGCFFQKELPQQNYYIQLWWESKTITMLRKSIIPLVDAIINQELGRNEGASLFLPKGKAHQPVSLYYLKNMYEDGEKYLLEALDTYQEQQPIVAPKHVTIKSYVEFFGEWHDELVILVDDQEGELSTLNKAMKTMVHQVADTYKKDKHRDLYDIKTSEQFPFVPHIGLGRIRSHSIRQLVQNPSDKSAILKRIKERIKQEVLPIVETKIVKLHNEPLLFKKLSVFALPKRARIKEYPLKSKNIFFITGTSGSGKSLLTHNLKKRLHDKNCMIYDFDEKGVPEGADEAWRQKTTRMWLTTSLENAQQGKSTIICGVSVPSEVMKFLKNKTTPVLFGFIKMSDELIFKRLNERHWAQPLIEDNINWAHHLEQEVRKTKKNKIVDCSSLNPDEMAHEFIQWILNN